jgi:hypothetical protein
MKNEIIIIFMVLMSIGISYVIMYKTPLEKYNLITMEKRIKYLENIIGNIQDEKKTR